jgi:uncharacterized OsmC-like protein
MAIYQHRTVSVLQETGMVAESSVRGFKVIVDEPKSLGGTNTGMNPVEMLMCALGSCNCLTARFFAMLQGIDLKEYRVELESDLDPDGFLKGSPGIRPGLQEIRMTVHVKSKASREKIQELLTSVISRCPVGETILNGVSVVASHEIVSELQ